MINAPAQPVPAAWEAGGVWQEQWENFTAWASGKWGTFQVSERGCAMRLQLSFLIRHLPERCIGLLGPTPHLLILYRSLQPLWRTCKATSRYLYLTTTGKSWTAQINHLEVGMEAEFRLKLILSVKKRDVMQWECFIREAFTSWKRENTFQLVRSQ